MILEEAPLIIDLEESASLAGDGLWEEARQLARRIGVEFKHPALLRHALTHRSATLLPGDSNERLEFLGDSVLGQYVCERLYRAYPELPEGRLAKAKAYIVSEPVLADAGRAISLGDVILISSGEEASGGRDRPSILSDAFEALIAAIYLDQGVRCVHKFLKTALEPAFHTLENGEHLSDFKSMLQEITQAIDRTTPSYTIVSEEGEDHAKTFRSQVRVGDRIVGEGTGRTKKQAEQAAAEVAWQKMKRVAV